MQLLLSAAQADSALGDCPDSGQKRSQNETGVPCLAKWLT